jgi:hypothetical protein
MRQRGRFRIINAWAAALLVGLLTGPTSPALAQDPDFLTIGIGGFDVNDNETAAEFRIEYRSGRAFFFLKPMIGLLGNSKGGIYGYGGVNLDIYLGTRWVVMPSFAIGGYRRGSAKDLGSVIELRSGIEIAYRFANRARLGVAVSHISNAGISDNNPGTESILLSFSIPLRGTP